MARIWNKRVGRGAVAVAVTVTGLLNAIGPATGSTRHSTPPHASPTVNVSDGSKDKSVTVALHGRVRVQLHSTYWSVPVASRNLLSRQSSSTVGGGLGCSKLPGSGCGTVTATFVALRTGTVQLSSHRRSCGEALLCTGGAGSWSATVRVVTK